MYILRFELKLLSRTGYGLSSNAGAKRLQLLLEASPYCLPQGTLYYLSACRKETTSSFPVSPTDPYRLEGTTLAKLSALPQAITVTIPAQVYSAARRISRSDITYCLLVWRYFPVCLYVILSQISYALFVSIDCPYYFVCTYVYMYVCVSLSLYVYIYIYIYICTHINVYMCIYVCIYLSIDLSIYLSISLSLYIYIYIYIHTNTGHTHTHTYTSTRSKTMFSGSLLSRKPLNVPSSWIIATRRVICQYFPRDFWRIGHWNI